MAPLAEQLGSRLAIYRTTPGIKKALLGSIGGRMLRTALFALLAFATASGNAARAGMSFHAYLPTLADERLSPVALRDIEPEPSRNSIFIPSSPLVLRAQQLLRQLDLYQGPADGQLNGDAEAAIRSFRHRSGLEHDARIDEELISRLEFAIEAGRLVSRLDEVRHQQQERAREALASAAATRSLLSETDRLGTADPTRNTDVCVSVPNVDCLVAEAIESAKAIHRAHFRDWVLGEAVEVQARTGRVSDAIATAGLIEDPRLVLVALRRVAEAAAFSGRVKTAIESAAIIPDPWVRAEASIGVVSAHFRSGRPDLGNRLAEEIAAEIVAAETRRPRASLLVRLANTLSDGGSTAEAEQTLERALGVVHERAEEEGRDPADLAAIAAGFARFGKTAHAERILDDLADKAYHISALIEAARHRGRIGDLEGVREVVAGIETPRYRTAALIRAAVAGQGAADDSLMRTLLPDALDAASGIDGNLTYARSEAMSRIAVLWARAKEVERAAEIGLQIPDARLRAATLWEVAAVTQPASNDYTRYQAIASRETAAVGSSLDRSWISANAALTLVDKGHRAEGYRLLAEGVRTAISISNPWGRAQALVKLADVLHTLDTSSAGARRPQE